MVLGGVNVHGGVPRSSPKIGDPGKPLDAPELTRALTLLWAVSLGGLGIGAALLAIL